jgi:hypothetical protein
MSPLERDSVPIRRDLANARKVMEIEVVENACRLPCLSEYLASPMILFQKPNKRVGAAFARSRQFYFGALTE